ncbi:PREDICTED: uncharacterized protein LOC105561709 [Vollenhovia emeryi]|uniref:uncharacterized protein LOC105561709 n=1 Tax=Vollenhovia emeryi TaxID=411798 RepID=UPI0005F45F74|nr:PREDICTED: uncharacterized protein LOC105561709 [Vollenhovia emeryi]
MLRSIYSIKWTTAKLMNIVLNFYFRKNSYMRTRCRHFDRQYASMLPALPVKHYVSSLCSSGAAAAGHHMTARHCTRACIMRSSCKHLVIWVNIMPAPAFYHERWITDCNFSSPNGTRGQLLRSQGCCRQVENLFHLQISSGEK